MADPAYQVSLIHIRKTKLYAYQKMTSLESILGLYSIHSKAGWLLFCSAKVSWCIPFGTTSSGNPGYTSSAQCCNIVLSICTTLMYLCTSLMSVTFATRCCYQVYTSMNMPIFLATPSPWVNFKPSWWLLCCMLLLSPWFSLFLFWFVLFDVILETIMMVTMVIGSQ